MGAGSGATGSPQGPRPEPSAGAKVAGGTRRGPPPAPARGEPSGAGSCGHGRAAARAAGGEWDAAGAEVSPPLAAAAPSSASSPPAARCGCPCGRCEERDRPAAPRAPRGKDTPEIPDEAEVFSCIGAGRCGSPQRCREARRGSAASSARGTNGAGRWRGDGAPPPERLSPQRPRCLAAPSLRCRMFLCPGPGPGRGVVSTHRVSIREGAKCSPVVGEVVLLQRLF